MFNEETQLEICKLYQLGNENSTYVLANQFNCTHVTISRILKTHNVPIRCGKGSHSNKNKIYGGKASGTKYYRRKRDAVKGDCTICGGDDCLSLHHIDGNHYNNEDYNMLKVCRKCHFAIHSYLVMNVSSLIKLRKDGWSMPRLAKHFGVSITKVANELAFAGLSKQKSGYKDKDNYPEIRYYAKQLMKG